MKRKTQWYIQSFCHPQNGWEMVIEMHESQQHPQSLTDQCETVKQGKSLRNPFFMAQYIQCWTCSNNHQYVIWSCLDFKNGRNNDESEIQPIRSRSSGVRRIIYPGTLSMQSLADTLLRQKETKNHIWTIGHHFHQFHFHFVWIKFTINTNWIKWMFIFIT
jgi:hypothetical protein